MNSNWRYIYKFLTRIKHVFSLKILEAWIGAFFSLRLYLFSRSENRAGNKRKVVSMSAANSCGANKFKNARHQYL